MHVGDGTWDKSRDDFLLPNLVGLNFATMRYNGMGNRFLLMTGYHSLIRAHGIIAAITFLGIVPAAIFLMRFYGRAPRTALRFHIWLQILTLLLSTVVIALGLFAVGSSRSLTNPHHGIGIAIYILIWWQTLTGLCFHRWEKNRKRLHMPIGAMFHHWLGRAIALLAIAQVALGLTLYGSPKYLFILYTFWVFGLVVLYFVLEWLHERRVAELGSGGGSYYSDDVVEERKDNRHGFAKLAAGGLGVAGLAALWRRRSQDKRRPEIPGAGTGVSDGYSYSYYSDEKVEPRRSGWGKRILEIGAVGGGIAAAKRVFGRRNDSVSSVASGPVRPPLGGMQAVGGNQSVMTDSVSRLEEGRPVGSVPGAIGQGSPGFIRPTHPLANPPLTAGRRDSAESYEYYGSDISGSPSKNKTHGFRNALAAGGMFFAAKSLFKNRRQRKEEEREESIRHQRQEEERIARMNSVGRYTGDGVAPQRYLNQGYGSQTVSNVSGSFVEGPSRMGGALPVAGVGVAAATALADRNRIRPVGEDPMIITPGPASAMPPSNMPPIPPAHQSDYASSGSEMYTTGSGRNRHRHHNLRNEAAAGLAGAALGAVATDAVRNRRDSRQTANTVESPPVSLKMKVHNDGRHVTLRRLTEEEAAAQRAEGRATSSSRRRRNSSFSSSNTGSGILDHRRTASADRRFRRDEAIAAGGATVSGALPASHPAAYPPPPPPGIPHQRTGSNPPFAPPAIDPGTGRPYGVPAPPPIPSSSPMGGAASSVLTSPGTDTSTPGTDYLSNRRRRRAERAQARLAKEGRAGGGTNVEFT